LGIYRGQMHTEDSGAGAAVSITRRLARHEELNVKKFSSLIGVDAANRTQHLSILYDIYCLMSLKDGFADAFCGIPVDRVSGWT
jgi:hypothetical protein